MIKCELCGKEFKRLRKHLIHEHDMTVKRYLFKFPNALVVDPEYAEKMRKKRKPSDIKAFKKVVEERWSK